MRIQDGISNEEFLKHVRLVINKARMAWGDEGIACILSSTGTQYRYESCGVAIEELHPIEDAPEDLLYTQNTIRGFVLNTPIGLRHGFIYVIGKNGGMIQEDTGWRGEGYTNDPY